MIAVGLADGSAVVWSVQEADMDIGLATSLKPAASNKEDKTPVDFISRVVATPPANPQGHTAAVRRVVWLGPFILTASDDGCVCRVCVCVCVCARLSLQGCL